MNPIIWAGLPIRVRMGLADKPIELCKRYSLDEILSSVSDVSKITKDDIKSPTRIREVADARAVYCYLARMDGHSWVNIGRYINRDHATALHNNRKVNSLLKIDKDISNLVVMTKEELRWT